MIMGLLQVLGEAELMSKQLVFSCSGAEFLSCHALIVFAWKNLCKGCLIVWYNTQFC